MNQVIIFSRILHFCYKYIYLKTGIVKTSFAIDYAGKTILLTLRRSYVFDFPNDIDHEVNEIITDNEYNSLFHPLLNYGTFGHNIFIILPFVKWGANKKFNTTPDLQLQEATTLVETLQNWKIVGKVKIPVSYSNSTHIFGSGNMENIKFLMKNDPIITAVFISINFLTGAQHSYFSEEFGITVFDRYTLVLTILKEHAKTFESKLQVAHAEIAYLKSRLNYIHKNNGIDYHFNHSIGKCGQSYFKSRKQILKQREHKILTLLNKLSSKRLVLKKRRIENEFPTVAVIGYTNSGKTSLIKSITGETRLIPNSKMFSTLDVTNHAHFLPSNIHMLFIDTMGFISDIPIGLIASFRSTLSETLDADLLVHVWDVSHPDCYLQYDNVISTLQDLCVSTEKLNSIITVGNKIDLVSDFNKTKYTDIFVSCKTKQGIYDLECHIDQSLQKLKSLFTCTIRVRIGSPEFMWISREIIVTNYETCSENLQYVNMKVMFTRKTFGKFQKLFANFKLRHLNIH